MTEQPILIAPVVHQVTELPPIVVEQQMQQRLATPEEIRAADQVFANQQNEQQLVSGLLGLYTGTLLLRDLAAEHLNHEDDELLKPEESKKDEDAE